MRGKWEGIGFILDFEDREPDEVAFILKVPGGVVDINDLRKAAAAPALYEALERACEIIADLSHFANNNGAMIDDETFAEGLAALSLAHPPANHTEESKP